MNSTGLVSRRKSCERKKTRKEPKFPSFRGVKRNRERALGLKSTPLDKRIRGS
jgi:hypothetical protein